MLWRLPGAGRRNTTAVILAGACLAVAYVAIPHRLVRYAAYLAVFTVWMAWFVATFVQWLGRADF